MYTLPITEESLREAISIIHSGGVVCHPTETCYGLACDLTNADAVEKLFALKSRPTREPVSALFPSTGDAKKYVLWNTLAEELAKKYLPGPLTIVLPLKGNSPRILYTVPLQATSYKLQAGIGIRISSHPVAQELSKRAGIPLSTTSANVHGEPSPYSVEEVKDQFSGKPLQPDLILDGGVLPIAPPSTVVLVTDGRLEVLRKGSLIISTSNQ